MRILSSDAGVITMARRISDIDILQKYIVDATLWHKLQKEKDRLVVEMNTLAKEIGEVI